MSARRRPFDWAFLFVAALSASAAAAVFFKEGWAVFRRIALEDAWLFVSVLPKVIAGCVIAALFRLMVPQEFVRRHLGESSGFKGLALSTAAGAILPGGPFTIFPMSAALLASGASRAATASFLSAWLLLSFNRTVIWELPFLGPDFTALRIMTALPLPFLIGLGVRWLDAAFQERAA